VAGAAEARRRYPVEVDGELCNLMERFGGVKFEVQ
jgi:hypothetical protein